MRDGSRVRIVIEADVADIDEQTRGDLLDLFSCMVDATGYSTLESELSDGDQWGRWTYTEDSDGNITWTASD